VAILTASLNNQLRNTHPSSVLTPKLCFSLQIFREKISYSSQCMTHATRICIAIALNNQRFSISNMAQGNIKVNQQKLLFRWLEILKSTGNSFSGGFLILRFLHPHFSLRIVRSYKSSVPSIWTAAKIWLLLLRFAKPLIRLCGGNAVELSLWCTPQYHNMEATHWTQWRSYNEMIVSWRCTPLIT
jgi:hypothetical protein